MCWQVEKCTREFLIMRFRSLKLLHLPHVKKLNKTHETFVLRAKLTETYVRIFPRSSVAFKAMFTCAEPLQSTFKAAVSNRVFPGHGHAWSSQKVLWPSQLERENQTLKTLASVCEVLRFLNVTISVMTDVFYLNYCVAPGRVLRLQ